jgi:hypothetical protein
MAEYGAMNFDPFVAAEQGSREKVIQPVT